MDLEKNSVKQLLWSQNCFL